MIIGIDGYAGAGKDTVADVLTSIGFSKVSFADELRRTASHAFGFSMDTFIDRDLKDKLFDKPYILTPKALCEFCDYLGFEHKCDEVVIKFKHTEVFSPRHLLQFVGTEVARQTLAPSIWLDKYLENIQGKGLVVTPDARFDNERDLIKGMSGLVMWIDRKGVEPESKHVSANEKWPLDKYDLVVYNQGTRYDLKEEISLWWSLVGHKK